MRIKERVLYDPRVRWYEIVFSIIGAVKIPVLAYFFVVTNGWNLVFYSWTFLWVIGVVLDYCIGRVIAKKSGSVFLAIMICLSTYAIFVIASVLLLFLKTGGSTFPICGDMCSEASFGDGVLYMACLIGVSMAVIMVSTIINAILKWRNSISNS